MKVIRSVEQWLSFDDAVVLKLLEDKPIRVYREGEKVLLTKIENFYCFATSDVPNRKIALLEIEDGTILADKDLIGVEIDNASLKRRSSHDL